MESQKKYKKSFSCEFFPPKTEKGQEKLRHSAKQLQDALQPTYFSVTYGAGGTTRDNTLAAITAIKQHTSTAVAPHLTCVASTRENTAAILQTYIDLGVTRIVALRGDIPDNSTGMTGIGDFHYATELVRFIREYSGDHFHIEVAAYPEFHPEASSPEADIRHFKEKINAGASSAITQYFYSAEAYFRFIDSCEQHHIDSAIVPGIMPITNFTQLARFSDMCGAEIPRWLRQRLAAYGDDIASIRAYGLDVCRQLCQTLLDQGAPGLHFYTLNDASATIEIWHDLKLGAAIK